MTEATNERMPCPACAEPIMKAAKICPHCKTAVLSGNANKNAVLNLVWYIVVFLVLYYAITAFAEHETERMMRSLGI